MLYCCRGLYSAVLLYSTTSRVRNATVMYCLYTALYSTISLYSLLYSRKPRDRHIAMPSMVIRMPGGLKVYSK